MSHHNVDFVLDPDQIAWTPRGMTSVQALDELPEVCLLLLKNQPCEATLKRLDYFHKTYLKDGLHELAALVTRCIETARQIIAQRAMKDYVY
jgi:hypothetical protein